MKRKNICRCLKVCECPTQMDFWIDKCNYAGSELFTRFKTLEQAIDGIAKHYNIQNIKRKGKTYPKGHRWAYIFCHVDEDIFSVRMYRKCGQIGCKFVPVHKGTFEECIIALFNKLTEKKD